MKIASAAGSSEKTRPWSAGANTQAAPEEEGVEDRPADADAEMRDQRRRVGEPQAVNSTECSAA